MNIKYCKKCLFPETKPNIYFDKKGVCSACINYISRSKVDWAGERERISKIYKKTKKNSLSQIMIALFPLVVAKIVSTKLLNVLN